MRRAWGGVLLVLAGLMLVIAIPVAFIIVPTPLRGMLASYSRDEVARVRSPSGDVEGVVVESNGGAITSFGYGVYVTRAGGSTFSGTQVAGLYGAIRGERTLGVGQRAYGVNLRWVAPEVLQIEYLKARNVNQLARGPVEVGGRKITVTLVDGIDDPNACPGGMLYNLQMSRNQGGVCGVARH
jgi:hypothetical protein